MRNIDEKIGRFVFRKFVKTCRELDNRFKMSNGSWSGLVGDLISGEIDISVATLTMTTEREEVIDFVSPYFDQVIYVYIFFIAVKAFLSFQINIFYPWDFTIFLLSIQSLKD